MKTKCLVTNGMLKLMNSEVIVKRAEILLLMQKQKFAKKEMHFCERGFGTARNNQKINCFFYSLIHSVLSQFLRSLLFALSFHLPLPLPLHLLHPSAFLLCPATQLKMRLV